MPVEWVTGVEGARLCSFDGGYLFLSAFFPA